MAGNEPEREANTGSTGETEASPEPDASLAEVARARRRRVTKAVIAVVVVVVLVLFIVANSQPVEADFLVFKAHPRLIWVIVTCTVLGGILGYLLGRPGHEGRPKKKDDGP